MTSAVSIIAVVVVVGFLLWPTSVSWGPSRDEFAIQGQTTQRQLFSSQGPISIRLAVATDLLMARFGARKAS